MSTDERSRPQDAEDLEVDGAAAEEIRGGGTNAKDTKPTESVSLTFTKPVYDYKPGG